ncbi:MAG: hypothetical protein FWD39_05625 [Clostridiales bacterium]|nr:hypothetical protein [Clostridiales bacterium]
MKKENKKHDIKNTDKKLKYGCTALYCWSGINLFLSALILFLVISGLQNSPLLSMVFVPSEVAELSPKVIGAMNVLTILYNSYAVAMSIMVWFVTRNALRNKARWAFWALLVTIGFAEIFAFIASAPFNHTRWQVNVVLSLLYIIGMALTGYSLYGRGRRNELRERK